VINMGTAESEWLTELHAALAADPEPVPIPTLIKHAQRRGREKSGAKIISDDSGSSASRELVRTADAARYLGCASGTLSNWITYKKFTRADGLRKIGGITRIHMPTLRARVLDDTLMKKEKPA
jgi:hypothetical protein